MRTGKRINRREILKYAMGTCPAVCGFPSIVRASALGKNGSTAPSNRVVVGCIGNGAMGTVDIRGLTTQDAVHVAAVCDVMISETSNDGHHRRGWSVAESPSVCIPLLVGPFHHSIATEDTSLQLL